MSDYHRQIRNQFIDHFLDFKQHHCADIIFNEDIDFELLASRTVFVAQETDGIEINLDFLTFHDFFNFVKCVLRYYDTYKTSFIGSYTTSWFTQTIWIVFSSSF